MSLFSSLPILAVFVIISKSQFANDSAASKSAGGIVLTHEARISMQKEKLTIAPATLPNNPNIYFRITVEYEFLNESDHNITTEVAFPVPEYDSGDNVTAGGMRDFGKFRLWVEGKPLKYETEVKAYLDGKDISAILNSYQIDIATFGYLDVNFKLPDGSFTRDGEPMDIYRLPLAAKGRIIDM